MKPTKKPKPQDSTLRNVRAANKRIKALEAGQEGLENNIASHYETWRETIGELIERIAKLERKPKTPTKRKRR